MKKILSLVLALCMILALAACGTATPPADPGKATDAPATEAPAAVAGGTLAACIGSEPDTIDPALNSAVDGATLIIHLFSGLAKWTQDESGKFVLVADAAEELSKGVLNDDGTVTYTYKLREGLKWSDGKPVTAADFVFAWNRAASAALAADYGYMFEIVDGYDKVAEADDDGKPVNPDAKLNAKAVDERTIEVTISNQVFYWDELLAFPVYFPVREDVVADEKWATDPKTYVSNGPFKMTGWEHDSLITLEKNENYVDAEKITVDKLEFYLSNDPNNMVANFENNTWQFIDDVPTNSMDALKEKYPDEYQVVGQIGTYYVCWNVNKDILPANTTLKGEEAEAARAEIRNALSLIIDRNYIVKEIGKAGQVPAPSFVAMGMKNPDGTEFYQTAGSNKDFDGYYNVAVEAFEKNYESAIETLKKYYSFDEAAKKFTDFPTMTYLYNTSPGHAAIGEYIQSAFAAIGITMNLENQEWNTFLNTRKKGEYTLARNGWVADYTDPICFLDMWTSGSGNNDVQFGKDAHKDLAMYDLDLSELGFDDVKVKGGTWAETYDVLIAKIKACTDTELRFKLMHIAEDMLMSTGAITPIYYYTDTFMINKNVQGFFANPLGYKYFMYCKMAG